MLLILFDTISVVRKNNLQKVTGSRNMKIPTSTAPTAPIPVHTGYAVPIGIVWVVMLAMVQKQVGY